MESTDETGTVPETGSPARDAAQNDFPASPALANLTEPGAPSAGAAPSAIGAAITSPASEAGTTPPANEASIAPPASDADGRPPPPGTPPPPAAAPAAAPAVAPAVASDPAGFTLPAPTTPGEVFFAMRNGLPLNMRDSPPGLKRMFFEASKCIYAALCADAGDNSGVLHDGRWRYSIALALGSNKRPEEMGIDIYGRAQAKSPATPAATTSAQPQGDPADAAARNVDLGSIAPASTAAPSGWSLPQPTGVSGGGAMVSAPAPAASSAPVPGTKPESSGNPDLSSAAISPAAAPATPATASKSARELVDELNRTPWDENLTREKALALYKELHTALAHASSEQERQYLVSAGLSLHAAVSRKQLLSPEEVFNTPGFEQAAIGAMGYGGGGPGVKPPFKTPMLPRTTSDPPLPPRTIASAEVGGQRFQDTNPMARTKQMSNPNEPTLSTEQAQQRYEAKIAKAAGRKEAGEDVDMEKIRPANTNMENAHAEIGVIQQASRAGKTKDQHMTMTVSRKVCHMCKDDIAGAAEKAGLKSLRINQVDYDNRSAPPVQYYWQRGMKEIKPVKGSP